MNHNDLNPHHVRIVGITGGIASGKTTVCNMFKELGVPLIDMDVISRTVVEPGKPAYHQILEHFGPSVFQPDGTIHRKKLSDIIFNDPVQKKKLEHITHPEIFKEYDKQVDLLRASQKYLWIQVAVPLLFELQLQAMFDKIIVVYVPEAIQIERLSKRDQISVEKAMQIVRSQLPIDSKLQHADYIIRNDGWLDDTRQQVIDVFEKINRL